MAVPLSKAGLIPGLVTMAYLITKTRAVNWFGYVVSGAVTAFFGVFAGAVSMYMTACSATMTDAVGLTEDTSDQDNLKECIIAGAVLAGAAWAGSSIAMYGVAVGWFYADFASAASKRGIETGKFKHMVGHVHYPYQEEFESDITTAFAKYGVPSDHSLTFASKLYSNRSGLMEHAAYNFGFISGDRLHHVITDVDSYESAIETLSRFDGSTQVFAADVVLTNSTYDGLKKRDSTGYWASFTGWAGNTGYEQDLLDWGYFSEIARQDWQEEGGFEVGQVQGCDDSYSCYAVATKHCFAVGFSNNQGDQDAIVGEVYQKSYGGLDGDCEQG